MAALGKCIPKPSSHKALPCQGAGRVRFPQVRTTQVACPVAGSFLLCVFSLLIWLVVCVTGRLCSQLHDSVTYHSAILMTVCLVLCQLFVGHQFQQPDWNIQEESADDSFLHREAM